MNIKNQTIKILTDQMPVANYSNEQIFEALVEYLITRKIIDIWELQVRNFTKEECHAIANEAIDVYCNTEIYSSTTLMFFVTKLLCESERYHDVTYLKQKIDKKAREAFIQSLTEFSDVLKNMKNGDSQE